MAIHTIRVIDCETTGLDPATDKVVEVAWVDVVHDDTIEETQIGDFSSSLINPGRDIPAEASAIHHLTTKHVESSPRLEQIIGSFAPAAGEIIAAHNAAFDRSFLVGFEDSTQWICTRKCAMRIWPDAPAHSNQVLRYHLGLYVEAEALEIMPHRALHDVFVTASLLMRILDQISVETALQYSSEPCLLTKVSFGKHRGQQWKDVPKDYLRWCSNQDMDEDVKHTCQYWMR